jgi:hypothetical protein
MKLRENEEFKGGSLRERERESERGGRVSGEAYSLVDKLTSLSRLEAVGLRSRGRARSGV